VLDFVTAIWLGFIGACIGSFLNVVAYRMPRGMSVVWKPSHCPQCGHAIRPRDNVPVLGWLLLRGRCRDCGEPISPRYAIVEAVMAAAFFALAYAELFSGGANLPGGPFVEAASYWETVWNPDWVVIRLFAYHALLLSVLMATALIDQDRERVPWSLPIVAIVIAAVCSWQWRHLYVERTPGLLRVAELKAPVDALVGLAWGASPWIIAIGAAGLRGKKELPPSLTALAWASGVVGAYLGVRPAVRIAVLWIVAYLISRLLTVPAGKRVTPLASLWFAVFTHIVLWKQLAALVTW
jgi:leader peptidase (prepilin peptidase)/N-methyltransferase